MKRGKAFTERTAFTMSKLIWILISVVSVVGLALVALAYFDDIKKLIVRER